MGAMHGRRYNQWRLLLSAEIVLQLALKDLQKAPAGCGSGQANEQVQGAPSKDLTYGNTRRAFS